MASPSPHRQGASTPSRSPLSPLAAASPSSAAASYAASPPPTALAAASSSQGSWSASDPASLEAAVYDRFLQFSGFGAKQKAGEIDSAHLMKMCRECGLLNRTCTQTDIDLIFSKLRPKSTRKLNYTQFLALLQEMCEKRFPRVFAEQGRQAALMRVFQLIADSQGPIVHLTKHESPLPQLQREQLHRPSSSFDYTPVTLSSLLDRSPSDARGRKIY